MCIEKLTRHAFSYDVDVGLDGSWAAGNVVRVIADMATGRPTVESNRVAEINLCLPCLLTTRSPPSRVVVGSITIQPITSAYPADRRLSERLDCDSLHSDHAP